MKESNLWPIDLLLGSVLLLSGVLFHLQLNVQVLEQVQGGDLVVNRGNESRPKEGANGRDLNTVDSYETALKLSQVNTLFNLL
jgi:hypothetical protein